MNQEKNTTIKLYYLFDPLCGWCYGASPSVQKMQMLYPLEMLPTGLFYKTNRKMDAALANHAWRNDQRIEKMTGQPFSPAYLQNILQKNGNFDSENILLALTAVKQIQPEAELKTLAELQTIRYAEGQDNTDMAIIASVLEKLGLQQAIPLLQAPATTESLAERIQQGQQLMQALDAQGIPQLVIEKDGKKQLIPNALLYNNEAQLIRYIQQH